MLPSLSISATSGFVDVALKFVFVTRLSNTLNWFIVRYTRPGAAPAFASTALLLSTPSTLIIPEYTSTGYNSLSRIASPNCPRSLLPTVLIEPSCIMNADIPPLLLTAAANTPVKSVPSVILAATISFTLLLFPTASLPFVLSPITFTVPVPFCTIIDALPLVISIVWLISVFFTGALIGRVFVVIPVW